MSLEDILMRSEDLIEKEPLDCGGFGVVSLCFHKNHGLVVLKTVYTGPKRTEYNESLLEEGKIMHRLDHDRIVKLFGVILEDGNYSLVMEFLEKGNLMKFLKAVSVPLSVKGRIILEIIEGMSYLSKKGVVHKDLKPENILVDDIFHIKIADLGVASFTTWSKLTKEETNRLRKSKTSNNLEKNGGTLSYMAPEHLKCINTKPTEKSDVYSFAIVVWVILTSREPYENAMNENQVYMCVKNGNRPDMETVPKDSPMEIVNLMLRCWDEEPQKRPLFEECFQEYKPFYTWHLEKNINADVEKLKTVSPAPKDFVKRMQSLQLDCVAEDPDPLHTDKPGSLHSSDGLRPDNEMNECLFAPCPLNEPAENEEENLQKKLQLEYNYHTFGSRMDKQNHQVSVSMTEKIAQERERRVCSDSFVKVSSSGTPYNKAADVSMPLADVGQYGRSAARTSPTSDKTIPPKQGFEKNHFAKPSLQPGKETPSLKLENSFCPEDADIYRSQLLDPFTKTPVPESCGVQPFFLQTYPAEPSKTNMINPGMQHVYQHSLSAGIQEKNLQTFGFGSTYNSCHPGNLFIPETTGNVSYQPARSTAVPLLNGVPLSLGTHPSPAQEGRTTLSIYGGSGIQIGNSNVMHIADQKFPLPAQNATQAEEFHNILDSTSILQEEHLEIVQENLGRSWKHCARKLGFTETSIDEIDHDYERDGLKEKVYQMLQKWQMKEGCKGATVGKLAKALISCKRTDLVRKLQHVNVN
ncbi:receptor-interacting serine/threonine-protein kinase 1 isoform X2 [Protopterus annectens]|uniref:receptor-interacting serine/threonine-protein kinase 1 isoform X2 n=1 Tax=Protopterus annectens TaxID=7888 RepID=UPI001CFB7582|nr:receptor-interacting serine/threonine-protein kinase 1 isoform X2 [Protopterus annectens]